MITPGFGLVTGRITAIALDPSDATGNKVYLGTTGGGVWSSSNAGTSTVSNIVFNPLTDMVTALGGAQDASLSIGALTVQPGETGVILAGTGDPNDILDSYYGAGILRSTDGGETWSLITKTSDAEDGLSEYDMSFAGEGFAGFAWSTANPQVVVAAVTESYEGDVVDANQPTLNSEGLYYSNDGGATWHLATITDGSGAVVQSARAPLLGPNGNAATAVVWNPVRQLFIAAVRFHGYYESPDGVTWTRLTYQPSSGLDNTVLCPTNFLVPGDEACPIYRGALAVNPQSGDTFAWTVDIDNQDQGLWQDKCAISGSNCTNASITFAQQWNSNALETSTMQGSSTIADGNYNLTLAAVPSGQDTLVLAGANDLWKCSLAVGCVWRNTTNSTTCMSAEVGEFQHALAWNTANPLEVFLGNDSGLWRSTDAIGETGSACSATDSTHFENLNGSLGSLAEVESFSFEPTAPYALMAGLGVNGIAGVKGSGETIDWPQILSGYGGPVVVDPSKSSNWYVNDQPGVAIYLCSQIAPCTPSAFGTTPVVTDADVGGDGNTMPLPATFLVDPLNADYLLVATCRVWRGMASGTWTSANAISPILDNASSSGPCDGDALIRSIAVLPLSSGGEMIYVGMYGSATNGSLLPGHILSAVFNPTSGTPTWNDLTLNPVTNVGQALNYYGLDISSIVIDAHDPTGNTVYVTVEGVENLDQEIRTVYRSTDGGATWTSIGANLPHTAVSSLAVDPQSASTVYVATDVGVYFTTEVSDCVLSGSNCWTVFGTGLPPAPAVALSTVSVAFSSQVLVAATYGRGIWQTQLWSAGTALSAASVAPTSLTFPSQVTGTISSPSALTLFNTGSVALAPTSITYPGGFNGTDNCAGQSIAPSASCTISVTFTPPAAGPVTGQMTIFGNIYGGQISVDLNGTGTAAAPVNLSPTTVSFDQIKEGTISPPQSVVVANGNSVAVPISSLAVTAPFVLLSNGCGTTSLAGSSDCEIQVEFAPTTSGTFTGLLTLTDGSGTQIAQLSGTAVAGPTDIINPPEPNSLAFSSTPEGQLSAAMPVTITNIGGLPLTGITVAISGQFQQANNCGTQLAAGAVCTISVAFAPTQLGALSGTLTVMDGLKTQTVTLSGTGLSPPVLNVTPLSLTFANTAPGVASAPQPLTIANAGATPMANIGFAFSGMAASNYSVSTTTCGAVLNGDSNCIAQIVFTPSAPGTIPATLAISSSTAEVAPVSVALNGTGVLASGLTTNPALVNLLAVAVGQTSPAQPVTITNSTSYAIGAMTLAVNAPFSISQNGCSGSLAAGANCTVSVVFAPTASGSATGTLTVSSSAVATPATVALAGAGVPAGGLTMNPVLLTFPVTAAGQTSAAQPVTITNATSYAIGAISIVTSAPFSVSQNGCTGSLAAGANCTVSVVFAPTADGSATGTLTASSSAVATPATVALSGAGFDFTVSISGPSSQTVARGQQGNYTLVVTPSGANATFTFGCGTLPTDALCLFKPTAQTLNAGVQGDVLVQISTTAALALMERPGFGQPGSGGSTFESTLPLACGLLLLPFAIYRRRRSIPLALLLAVLVCSVSSCTSSGGGTSCTGSSCSQQGGGGTPTGTYTIPVTVTANGLSQSLNVTLTVD